MKKKALRKDFYMEIRKSKGRFLSILFIVALGVAFFSGIRSAEPDIRYSGDEYFDEYGLYDGKVLSTGGLTKEDLEAISKVEGVEKAEGIHSVDVICNLKDSQKVLHVKSLSGDINKLRIDKGRLPQKRNECFVDNVFMNYSGFKIGDMITFESGNEDHIKDSLTTNEFKIVGVGSSPNYISFSRGSSFIGTGEVSGFVYVTKESFSQEVFTDVDISIKGAQEPTAFTKPYEDCVEETLDRVKEIEGDRVEIRQNEIKEEANIKIGEAQEELDKGKKEASEELVKAAEKLDKAEQEVITGKQQIEDGRLAIKDAKNMLQTKQNELDDAVLKYEQGRQQFEAGAKELNTQIDTYNAQYPEAMEQLVKGEAKITEARSQLDIQWAQYYELLKTTPPEYLVQMKQVLDQGELELTTQQEALRGGQEQLSQGQTAIDHAKVQIEASKVQLSSAWEQINNGQIQLSTGRNELEAKEKELNEAELKVTSGEAELQAGRSDYEKAKIETDEKLKSAEKKITEAKKKLAEVEPPTWYVEDRNYMSDYTGYGENADRMRAIGRVFPLMFFLVAALISLTTMTRMIEEERTQIGTLKALGYSKLAIMKKYLYYALLASFLGSVLGVLVGEKVLPYIIVFAYKSMYANIPNIVIPYNLSYAIIATVAAVACIVISTIFACFKEMLANPAVLMRPPTPKKGKRIVLEKVPFIWNRLNFTWKSTMRNLIRYKKRFFMTVFGIGGCMALMLVGFGLKDSILGIGNLQYGEIEQYDATTFLKDSITKAERESLDTYLESENRIKSYTNILMKNVDIENADKEREAYLFVPEDTKEIETFINFRDRTSKELRHMDENGIILTEKMSKLLGVGIGDKVEIELEKGIKKSVAISNISENYMGHYIYMSPKLYTKLMNEELEYNGILMKKNDITEAEMLKVGEEILDYEGVLNVSYSYNIEEQLNDMLGSLNIVIVVLIISAGMLAFVVLYNLNNININERKRELATIKVLGFYDLEVAEYVYRENLLLTLIGCGAGAIIGKILHRFVITTVEIDMAMFGRNIDPSSFVYSILFTIGFSLFVNLVMFYKLKKIDMVESLKSIE